MVNESKGEFSSMHLITKKNHVEAVPWTTYMSMSSTPAAKPGTYLVRFAGFPNTTTSRRRSIAASQTSRRAGQEGRHCAIAVLPDTRSIITSNTCWAIYNSILRHSVEPQAMRNRQLTATSSRGISLQCLDCIQVLLRTWSYITMNAWFQLHLSIESTLGINTAFRLLLHHGISQEMQENVQPPHLQQRNRWAWSLIFFMVCNSVH
jgi:hypothetical protein